MTGGIYKIGALLMAAALMAGCGGESVNEEEESALEDVFGGISELRGQYTEFDKVYDNVQRGPGFISYVNDLNGSGATPMMSSSYFWVKVSLAKRAVEPADLQPPLLTLFIPRFNKYLKLRLTTVNAPLEEEIAGIFQRKAVELGGTDAHWGNTGNRGPGTRRRTTRRLI